MIWAAVLAFFGALMGGAFSHAVALGVHRNRVKVAAMVLREDLYALQDQIAGDVLDKKDVFILEHLITEFRHTDADLARFASTTRKRLKEGDWKALTRSIRHGRAYLAVQPDRRKVLNGRERALLWRLYEESDTARKSFDKYDRLGTRKHSFFEEVKTALTTQPTLHDATGAAETSAGST